MTEKYFNPYDWIEKQQSIQPKKRPEKRAPRNIDNHVEVITRRIENARLDMTTNYTEWMNIGFAMADEFGENGRDYFHRLSRFHVNYKPTQCDKQFDRCIKGNKKGISIRTFFFMAKNAGINIRV